MDSPSPCSPSTAASVGARPPRRSPPLPPPDDRALAICFRCCSRGRWNKSRIGSMVTPVSARNAPEPRTTVGEGGQRRAVGSADRAEKTWRPPDAVSTSHPLLQMLLPDLTAPDGCRIQRDHDPWRRVPAWSRLAAVRWVMRAERCPEADPVPVSRGNGKASRRQLDPATLGAAKWGAAP
jgi:hypothetical protein